jgi:carbon-monoxide dehydrogenase large subunit
VIENSNGTARPGQYVGARVPRVEDRRYLMGQGRYVDDIDLRGMLHVAFVRSPHAHARILQIDTEAAQTLEGVVAVFTGEDLADVPPFVTAIARDDVKPVTRRLLPSDKVRFVGEAIVAVIARSRALAEDGCELVEVDYEPLPVVVDPEEALRPGAPVLHEDVPDNNIAHIEMENGDVEQAFAAADLVVTKRFRSGRVIGAPLETRGVVANYDVGAGQLTVWTSTQMPHFVRTMIAPTIGMSEGTVQVIAPDVGGGFGLKAHIFIEEALIPLFCRRLRKPVKWIEDRIEHNLASAHSKGMIMEASVAASRDGTILGLKGRYVADSGAYSIYPWTALIDPLPAASCLPGIYDVRNVKYVVDAPLTNKCQTSAYRGVGMTSGHTLRETLLDDLARELDMDPVQLRLKNCISGEPYRSATGLPYDGGSYRECIVKATEMLDYEGFRERQAEARARGRHLGIGFSPYVEPCGWGSKGAQAIGFPAEFYDTVSVTVEPDGSVIVSSGSSSHGQGLFTTLAQIVADRLGVKIENVRVVDGDSTRASYGFGTFASRSAVVHGSGAFRAATDIRDKLVRIAANLLEAHPDDIDLQDGQAFVKGVPDTTVPIAQVATVAYFGGDLRPADQEHAMSVTRHADPEPEYSNGIVACTVDVDIETGAITILDLVSVEDCGTMLNPMIVEGQVFGAIAQGIGVALYESLEYSPDGQMLSATLMDYLFPSSMDVPHIDTAHFETRSPHTENGQKGMGEAGTIGAPAAILNAVADALSPFGARVDRSPIRPEDVCNMVRGAVVPV